MMTKTPIRRKGQKLIHGLVSNWLEDAGSLPTHQELFDHLFLMEDKEFDSYLNEEFYNFRQQMQEEGDRQMKLIQDKHQLRKLKEDLKNKNV